MMQLHRLEGFYRVALARGYARAARTFPYPITVPGVFAQVRNLESDLGVRLFDRVAKDRLRLTPQGESLFRFCAPFFEGLPAVADAIAARSFGGTLRIDASTAVMQDLLPRWLARLRRSRPDVRVAASEPAPDPLDRLRSGEADLLVDWIARVPSGLESRVVAHTHSLVVCPAAWKLSNLESLRKRPFIAYAPELAHHAVQMEAVRARLGVPDVVLTAPSAAAILAFVRAGIGYSVILTLERAPRIQGVRCVVARGLGTRFEIRAVWRKTEWPHPLLEAALATMAKAALRGVT